MSRASASIILTMCCLVTCFPRYSAGSNCHLKFLEGNFAEKLSELIGYFRPPVGFTFVDVLEYQRNGGTTRSCEIKTSGEVPVLIQSLIQSYVKLESVEYEQLGDFRPLIKSRVKEIARELRRQIQNEVDYRYDRFVLCEIKEGSGLPLYFYLRKVGELLTDLRKGYEQQRWEFESPFGGTITCNEK